MDAASAAAAGTWSKSVKFGRLAVWEEDQFAPGFCIESDSRAFPLLHPVSAPFMHIGY